MFLEHIGYKLNSKVKVSLENITHYPIHLHTSAIEIICVLDGSISISDSALNHKLSAGDVYIFNAKDPHRIITISENNIILTVQIDIEYYKRYIDQLNLMYFVCDSFINKDQLTSELRHLRFLLAQIFQEYRSKKSSSKIEALAKELFIFLTEQFRFYTYSKSEENSYDIIRRQETKANTPSSDRIYDIIDYIYANFRSAIRLDDIAKLEYLSVYYLSRYIKKVCGLSFSELVSIARCEEAERLLGTTNKSVDTIAAEVGFANRKHLAINFKEWYHMTPTEYRKALSRHSGVQPAPQYGVFTAEYALSILNSYLNEA